MATEDVLPTSHFCQASLATDIDVDSKDEKLRPTPSSQRPPLHPKRANLPPSGLSSSAVARAKRRPPSIATDVPQGCVFDMSTPKGQPGAPGAQNQTAKHFIGTPTATGILSAFLDFDIDDADCCGPPLEPDYDAFNLRSLENEGVVTPQNQNEDSKHPKDDGHSPTPSIHSTSTQFHMGDGEDSDDDEKSIDGDASARRHDDHGAEEEVEEEYEDDFEEDSDEESDREED
eukprot:TRINITY_DN95890_c0_g1_i1.p1 TRINITY_DN95890_c0_g1~~TRINITY_DN95890_c0_g1_i1.p1  ORF type:complete len:231 (+),score=52.81 TRINITY_DN95890_c0_g1_i1:51-743(+)